MIERGQTNKQEDIRAVICDFGLAVTKTNINNASPGLKSFFSLYFLFIISKINSSTKKSKKGLSPQYTPPEIFNSVRLKTSLDLKDYQQGDIFSFGVILWEIITRRIPWEDFSFEDIEFSIRFSFKLLIFFLQSLLINNQFITN